MTDRVALLDDAVANQIAAGEVVERPASVVKELVENALDAEAGVIFVDVIEGGRDLIRVVDDGLGMSRADATLAIQRHATSKIREAADLDAIDTLGFRGEALPSIASVSRFSMVTRREEDDVATRVVVEGGATATVRDDSGPTGSRVEVRDLFFAVPARLKFLKRASTEVRHISALMTRFALGYPHVQFRLMSNDRKVLDVPRATSLRKRIYQILGNDVVANLMEIEGRPPISVRGFITDPKSTRGNRTGLHTFVNGRAVEDKVVLHGIQAAYGELLPRGRYPVGVLYVHVPAGDVDVNVHPAKAEVRFVRSGEVHQAIARAIKHALTKKMAEGADYRPVSSAMGALGGPASYATGHPTASPPAGLGGQSASGHEATPGMYPGQGRFGPVSREWQMSASEASQLHQKKLTFVTQPTTVGAGVGALPTGPRHNAQAIPRFANTTLTGQTDRGYIVCEDDGGLTIIHTAHAFSHIARRGMLAALRSGRPMAAQPLLLPVQVEVSASDATRLQRHGAMLSALGLVVEPFGGPTWQVTSVPGGVTEEPTRLLQALLAALSRCDADAGGQMAQHAAVDILAERLGTARAGRLADAQVHQLLGDLDDAGERHPGEPRYVARLSWEELDNRFSRSR